MNTEQLGERAKQILADPAYKMAMDSMKSTIFEAFRRCKIDEYDEIRDMHLLMRAADIFESRFEKMINDAVAELANREQGKVRKIERG